jgi:hypothetical protein
MGDELKTFKGDKHSQNDSKYIQKARAMTVTPPFDIGDDTHDSICLVRYKVYKKERATPILFFETFQAAVLPLVMHRFRVTEV